MDMHLKDSSRWIWNEVKQSKVFTLLNIIGVWINVCILVIFLALAFGIENTAINQITKDIDLFTLQVETSNFKPTLSFSDFYAFQSDRRIEQIIPVFSEFADLKIYNNIINNDKPDQSKQKTKLSKPIASKSIYTESYFVEGETGEDLRTKNLKFISGQKISQNTPDGIIISENVLNQLAGNKNILTQKNYANQTMRLVLIRSDKKVGSFPCKIVGIAEKTSFNGALVYVASPLAAKIDDWLNFRNNDSINYKTRNYKRFDLVTNNLVNLQDLRKELINQGYSTSSVLDDIDDVRSLLVVIKIIFFFIIGISALISAFNIIITLTSYVLKNQKEIGILKSLGATEFQIQSIFILHATYLCITGSILGTVTAYIIIAISQIVLSQFENLKDINLLQISFFEILIVVFLCLLLGMLASLIPARKAAAITPIETIRSS
ncbi:MAG: ABC transporter permease [Nostoc sp. GBBB01]|nr:ABC transporter permease [Nostoc sp. GBBB01]